MLNDKKPKKIELLVIVGMPGSGKTTYAKRLLRQKLIDGFSDDYEFGPLRRRNPTMRDEDRLLLEALDSDKRWAIADTRYCDPLERAKLIKALKAYFPNISIKFEYFENNPELCEHNATIRKGSLPRHEINLMYYYTKLYQIPARAKVKKIYKS